MKRTITLWLGMIAFALLPVLAQTPAAAPKATGKISGRVINADGIPATKGTVSLSNDGGMNQKFVFKVNDSGDYSGEATPGTYDVVFRAPETPADKLVDKIDNVKIVAGTERVQDIDMSRPDFLDKLTPEERKQLEEVKKRNAGVLAGNAVIKQINGDLRAVTQDQADIKNVHASVVADLGASASAADVRAKEEEIKTAKYTEIENLMLKDSAGKPDASVLWAQLGGAQVGLKKYDEALVSFKKILSNEAASKKPDASLQGLANAGVGEVYARTGKADDAAAAYDAAAKINPAQAGFYLKNEAVIFFQEHNGDAQAAAADKAILADPTLAIAYYLKGNGLIGKTSVDTKTNKLVAPPGCLEAYQKYLDLQPNGQYAGEIKGILAGFQATLPTNTAPTKKKK